jgi:hypothetical protein
LPRCCHWLIIQLHPVETAVLGIWINPYDCPIEPALISPDFCVEKDLDPITDLEGFAHLTLILSPRPAARQDIDSLQKKCASGKDDEYADDA